MPEWVTTDVREAFQRRRVFLWVGPDHHGDPASGQYDSVPTPDDRALASIPWRAVFSDSPSHAIEDCILDIERTLGEDARSEFRRPAPVARPGGDRSLTLGKMLPIYYLQGCNDAANREDRYGALPEQVRTAYRGSLVVALSSIQQEGGVLVLTGCSSGASLKCVIGEARAFLGETTTILALETPSETGMDPSDRSSLLLPLSPVDFVGELAQRGLVTEPGAVPEASIWVGSHRIRIDDILAGPLGRLDRSYRVPTAEGVVAPDTKDRELFDGFMLLNESRDAPDVLADRKEWQGIAAGFCVPRNDYHAENGKPLPDVVQAHLRSLERPDSEDAAITLELPVEQGAGTTALLHWLAFESARKGYPTFVLKQDATDASVGELINALTDINRRYRDQAGTKQPSERPALVVFDTQHSGFEDVLEAAYRIGQAGRRCVVLRASPAMPTDTVDTTDEQDDVELDARTVRGSVLVLNHLSAAASDELVTAARTHFSRVREDLPELGLVERAQEDWERFQAANSFRMLSQREEELAESLFWVALHYFLTSREYDTSETAPIPKRLGTKLVAFAEEDPFCAKTLLDICRFSRNGLYVNTVFLGRLEGDTFSRSIIERTRKLEDEQLLRFRWEEGTGENLYRLRHRLYARLLLREAVERREKLTNAGVPESSIPSQRDLARPVWMLVHFLQTIDGSVPGDIRLVEEIADGALRVPDSRSPAWRSRNEILQTLDAIPDQMLNSSRVVNHIHAMALWKTAAYDRALTDAEREKRFGDAVAKLDRALTIPSRQRQRDEHPGHILTTKGYAELWWARRITAERRPQLEQDAAGTFRKALGWIPSNTYAMYGLASTLVQRTENAKCVLLAGSQAAMVVEALNLLQAVPEKHDFRAKWFELQQRALALIDSHAPAQLREDLRESKEEAGFLLEAWASLGNSRIDDVADESRKEEAHRWVIQAMGDDEVRTSWRTHYLAYRLRKATSSLRGDPQKQYELLRLLNDDEEFSLRPHDQFELGILCYQLERAKEGVRMFKDLRASGGYREIDLGAQRYWLEPSPPFKPRRASLVVKRYETRYKGWGFVRELGEDVPFTPVHFDPDHAIPQGSEFPCYVRFSGSGPKAVPERFFRRGPEAP